MDDAAGTRFGRYELLDRIGRGGMGETWQARRADVPNAPVVVIKRMLPDLAGDAELVEAFVNEAHLTASLKHPNIAEVLDFGQAEGEYYFAIEFVHGCTVDALIHAAAARGLRKLPVPVACFIAAEVLAGLHHAHTSLGPDGRPLKLVHRDISPDNVLLGFDGRVKIIDFGVAKARMPRRLETAVGLVKGKVHYFSPEQARAQPLDGRSDVFAVGVMLYRLVCGTLPFPGAGVAATLSMLKGDFTPPHVANPALPTPLVDALNRALEIRLDRRFLTAANMETALRSLIKSTAPRFGAQTLRSFVHWSFADALAAEGVDPRISPVDAQDFERWVERERAPHSGAGFTPLDPRTRARTALADIPGRPRPRPTSRWTWLAAGAAMFVLGMVTTIGLSLPEAQPVAEVPPPASRRAQAFARAEEAYRALEKVSPALAGDLSDKLVTLGRQRGAGEFDDQRYFEECALLEQQARSQVARMKVLEELAARAHLAAPDAGAAVDRPTFFERKPLDLTSPKRVTLRFERHNLLLQPFEITGQNTWRSRYPDTIRFKVNQAETSVFAAVDFNVDAGVTTRAYDLSAPDAVDRAQGLRFYDFQPFAHHDPAQQPPEGMLFERFSNGRRLEAVRFSRSNGHFLEVIPATRLPWVRFARVAHSRRERFGVVINCGHKTEVLENKPVWAERPEACALALIGTGELVQPVEVAISAHKARN